MSTNNQHQFPLLDDDFFSADELPPQSILDISPRWYTPHTAEGLAQVRNADAEMEWKQKMYEANRPPVSGYKYTDEVYDEEANDKPVLRVKGWGAALVACLLFWACVGGMFAFGWFYGKGIPH